MRKFQIKSKVFEVLHVCADALAAGVEACLFLVGERKLHDLFPELSSFGLESDNQRRNFLPQRIVGYHNGRRNGFSILQQQ